jgi:hypothetical protein
MKKHKASVIFFLIILPLLGFSQDDMMKELENMEQKGPDYVTATFKGTRLINLHTIETLKKGSLDFRISHRFGDIGSGSKNLWGLDGPATLRLGFDYSLTDRLVIGIGRSSYQKLFDGFVKYKFKRQAKDGPKYSLVGITSINVTSDDDPVKAITGVDRYEYFSSRVSYMAQVLIARKFNQKLSLQVSPTLIHYNMVTRANDKNDMFSIGFSGRYKFTRSMAITAEYTARVTAYTPVSDEYHNAASIGLDIETGGHVFQLFFTNASAINEVQFIPYTTSTWNNKGFRFGFNISRVFQFSKDKKSNW